MKIVSTFVQPLPVLRLCDNPTLRNGTVRLRQRGKLIRYQCNTGFTLVGDRYSACISGRWENQVPICISRLNIEIRSFQINKQLLSTESGCKAMESPDNGHLNLQNNGAGTYLFCLPGYQLAGAKMAYCDGRNWDRKLGTCRKTNVGPQTSCDFEVDDYCGWSSDPEHDFEWKRRNGDASRKKLRTGPSHDHTTMQPLHGHYMVAQSADQMAGSAARLMSPVYPQKKSVNACFRFYYHMYGLLVGRLRVYMKPVSVSMDFTINEPK